MGHLKSLLNFLCCFYFMFWFFHPKASAILGPQSGIKPATSALEGKRILTPGQPKKSIETHFRLMIQRAESEIGKDGSCKIVTERKQERAVTQNRLHV